MGKDDQKDRQCVHCFKEGKIVINQLKNFTRHLKEHHNARYQELIPEGRKRCTNPEYNKDFMWASDHQQPLANQEANQRGQQVQEENIRLENMPKSQQKVIRVNDNEEEKQDNISESSEEQRLNIRKRDIKAVNKMEQSMCSIERRSAFRNSIGNHTDYSTFVESRITQIENENQGLRQELQEYIKQQNSLSDQVKLQHELILEMKQHLQQVKQDAIQQVQVPSKIQIHNIENEILQEKQNVVASQEQQQMLNQEVIQEVDNNKDNNKLEAQQIIQEQLKDKWKTWENVILNKEKIAISGTAACKFQGEERTIQEKSGIAFGDIVKKLIMIQKSGRSGDDYLDVVRDTFIGSKIKLGYKVQQVIGVGNLGTTIQADDLQRKEKVVLKVYHDLYAMNSAINEYQMLHAAQNAPSVVRVHSLIYNTRGQFLVISLEDLSPFKTLYEYCQTNKKDHKSMLVARNLCRAVAELHALDIIHGDLSSGNIIVDPATSEVKLIDFDQTSFAGTAKIAGGNEDFVNAELWKKIANQEEIESQELQDQVGLGLCVYLLIGDTKGEFLKQLDGQVSLEQLARHKRIVKDIYQGSKSVCRLISGVISASEAAIELDALVLREKA